MSKLAGVGINPKSNLRLILCLLGIAVVVAILINMKPLPNSKNSVALTPVPTTAKKHANGVVSGVSQAAPVVQTASSVAQPAGLGGSTASTTAPVSTPYVYEPDTPVLTDPIPCGGLIKRLNCDVCEAYPADDATVSACPAGCPRRGIDIMCAYP